MALLSPGALDGVAGDCHPLVCAADLEQGCVSAWGELRCVQAEFAAFPKWLVLI